MKHCPLCKRTYTDETLRFCLEDGTPLVASDQTTAPTLVVPAEPPPTVAYDPGRATANQPPPAWTPQPQPKPPRKVWPWVLGGLVLLFVLAGGFVLVLVILAFIGANADSSNQNNANRVASSSTPSVNQTPASTPASNTASTNVEIKNVYMAHDNGSEQPGKQTDSFTPSDRIIHCVVQLSDSQAGTVLKFNWIAVDAGVLKDHLIKELEYTTKAEEARVNAHLTLQHDWPEGDYKVDVYLNGQLARSITYKVAE